MFRVRDRVKATVKVIVRVRLWIVWYMDMQMAAWTVGSGERK